MLIKFITRSIRPLGMFLIFVFAVFCIFGSIFVRGIDRSTAFGRFLYYTVSFENRFYDSRMQDQLNPDYKSPNIVLIKIDDYSLQKIGTWPIPRTEYARLLDKLSVYGTKVVALDILFPEKSPSYGKLSPDQAFADAINRFQQEGKKVFLSYTLASYQEEALVEPPLEMLNDAVRTQNAAGAEMQPQKIARYTFPIPKLVESEVGLGSITMNDDSDGIFRQYQLIANVDTIYYGSLGFNAVEAFTGKKNTIRIFRDGSGELAIADKVMEISEEGETKIRYKGGSANFAEISLYDVLSAKDQDPKMKSFFKNKLVFVGSTANGAHDLRPTPLDTKTPGVYAHINVSHMLLQQYFFQRSNQSVSYSLYLLVAGMLILIGVGFFQNVILDALAVAGIIAGGYYLDQWYFMPTGYELKLFYCFFCFSACYSWNTFWEFWSSNKEKMKIKRTFARYVAPTVVEEMLKNPEKMQVGGSKMDITCLFSDVRDFTSISENMTASDLAHSLNYYMSRMTDIVFDTKGTLDKYIGDAIVAIWGAPLPIGNHAQQAVVAAIAMAEKMPQVNQEFVKLGRPPFTVGIGLNSGECSVGNMGSDRIFSYTALGDNMNLGARLEGLCKYYGTQILISQYTLERLDHHLIKTRPIDKVIVKGKTTPVAIHEVMHRHHPLTQDVELMNLYLTGFKLFQTKNFLAALELFSQLLKTHQDIPSQRLMVLCQKYLAHPELVGVEYDVTRMTEK